MSSDVKVLTEDESRPVYDAAALLISASRLVTTRGGEDAVSIMETSLANAIVAVVRAVSHEFAEEFDHKRVDVAIGVALAVVTLAHPCASCSLGRIASQAVGTLEAITGTAMVHAAPAAGEAMH